MVDFLFVCIALIYVMTGYRQGALRASILFVMWLSVFGAVTLLFIKGFQGEVNINSSTLIILKQISLAYFLCTVCVWLLNKFVIVPNFAKNESYRNRWKKRTSHLFGASLGLIKTYVFVLCVSLITYVVSGSSYPKWHDDSYALYYVSLSSEGVLNTLEAWNMINHETIYYEPSTLKSLQQERIKELVAPKMNELQNQIKPMLKLKTN